MTGLIAAEYVKLRKRTFFWVLAGLIWALHIFTAWLTGTIEIGTAGGGSARTVNFPDLVAMVLAVQILGSEFSGGRWAAGLTRDARRGAHLLAKAVTAFVGLLFIVAVAALLGQATNLVLGEDVAGAGTIAGDVGRGLIVGAVWILIGFALTALLRRVGISFIVVFILYNADGLVSLWDKYQPFSAAHNTGLLYSGGGGLPVLAVWGAATAAMSWALVRFRDA